MIDSFKLDNQIAGSYYSTERLTNGVAAQISATAVEDGSYDAEIIHDILPGGAAELADTSCLNRDTIRSVNEGSIKLEKQFADFTQPSINNNSTFSSVSKQQGILITSRQFRKQTEVSEYGFNRQLIYQFYWP